MKTARLSKTYGGERASIYLIDGRRVSFSKFETARLSAKRSGSNYRTMKEVWPDMFRITDSWTVYY